MWLRHLYFRDEYIGDPAEEAGSGGKTLLITDYMNIDSDEVDETPEDVS